jgi:hypothetical protein
MKITTDNQQYPKIKIKAMFDGKPKWARNSKRWMQPGGSLREFAIAWPCFPFESQKKA